MFKASAGKIQKQKPFTHRDNWDNWLHLHHMRWMLHYQKTGKRKPIYQELKETLDNNYKM